MACMENPVRHPGLEFLHLDHSGQTGGQYHTEELHLALPIWSEFFFFFHDFMISHPILQFG
jgi:hypothetical protein